jgi:hypothetical protein
VSGRGGAKYCWDVDLLVVVLVLVLVLDLFGNWLHKLYFSSTRTRTTTRTRNNLLSISGICRSSLCTQTAPPGPLFRAQYRKKPSTLVRFLGDNNHISPSQLDILLKVTPLGDIIIIKIKELGLLGFFSKYLDFTSFGKRV